MHSCVYVIIGKTGDIETQVDRAMQPFDETMQVKPYKLHLSASSVAAMAACYKLPQTDLQALAAKLKDWIGSPGGIDQFGLYTLLSHNPDGEFDWYEIGGRYHGWIRGRRQPKPNAKAPDAAANTLAIAALLRAKDFVKRVPFAIVTPHGQWIERSRVESTVSGWYLREESLPAWTRRVRAILRTFSGHRIVCVDAHS